MAKIRFVLNKSNIRRDGTCPVCLRITQNGRLKYIDLGLSATVEQWNAETERFKKDRRVVSNYENYNALLNPLRGTERRNPAQIRTRTGGVDDRTL